MPGRPVSSVAALSPRPGPRPPASTPISSTDASSMNAANEPIAFDPPPTQAIDVDGLATHVLFAHVHHALESEHRAHRGCRDAVLPGAGLGDDAPLAHALREQPLPDGIVDLVRAGVRQVFALEPDRARV